MTFRQFNVLNELFQQGKCIALRIPSEINNEWDDEDDYDNWITVATYDEDADINDLNHDIETHVDGKLFIFDGDFYEEIEI